MAVTQFTKFIKCVNAINSFKEDVEEENCVWHRYANVQSSSRSPEAKGDGCLQATIHLKFHLKEIVPPSPGLRHSSCHVETYLHKRFTNNK